MLGWYSDARKPATSVAGVVWDSQERILFTFFLQHESPGMQTSGKYSEADGGLGSSF